MISRKVVTWLFLAFTLVIAFYNLLLGHIQYSFFAFPFIISAILRNKPGLVIEALGVLAIAVYLMLAQALYIGVMGSVIAAVLFFTLGMKRVITHLYIYLSSVIVGFCAAINPYGYQNESIEVLLTAIIYYVCVFAIHIALDNYVEEVRNSKPLDSKCIDALEKSYDTARRAVDMLKEKAERGNHG